MRPAGTTPIVPARDIYHASGLPLQTGKARSGTGSVIRTPPPQGGATGMECRKSVADLTLTEKTDYVNAVLALKDPTRAPSMITAAQTMVTSGGGTPNRYDDYVWMHNQVGGGAHRGPAFGPWHREFLRQFEFDLRQVSGNDEITIPYW